MNLFCGLMYLSQSSHAHILFLSITCVSNIRWDMLIPTEYNKFNKNRVSVQGRIILTYCNIDI